MGAQGRSQTRNLKVVEGGGWVPVTPAGTPCIWLESDTEDQAWQNLLIDAAHMPYGSKKNFIKRGYTVQRLER